MLGYTNELNLGVLNDDYHSLIKILVLFLGGEALEQLIVTELVHVCLSLM